jgi:hypothetical protein
MNLALAGLSCGITVVESPATIGITMKNLLASKGK